MGVDSYARDTLLSDTSHVSHNIIQYLIQISRQMFLNPMCDMMLGEREREREMGQQHDPEELFVSPRERQLYRFMTEPGSPAVVARRSTETRPNLVCH